MQRERERERARELLKPIPLHVCFKPSKAIVLQAELTMRPHFVGIKSNVQPIFDRNTIYRQMC